jgi:hypothetical protein
MASEFCSAGVREFDVGELAHWISESYHRDITAGQTGETFQTSTKPQNISERGCQRVRSGKFVQTGFIFDNRSDKLDMKR